MKVNDRVEEGQLLAVIDPGPDDANANWPGRASRAMSVAMSQFARLASETCCGRIVPASFSRPSWMHSSWPCVTFVSMSASRTCWICFAPITVSNITRSFA